MKKTFSVYTEGAALLFALVGMGTGLAEESNKPDRPMESMVAKQPEVKNGGEKKDYSFPINVSQGKKPVSLSVDINGNKQMEVSLEANPLQSKDTTLLINGKKMEVKRNKEYCRDLSWKDDKGVEYKTIVITFKERDGGSKKSTIKGELDFSLKDFCYSHMEELAKSGKEFEASAKELCEFVRSQMEQIKNVEISAEEKIKIAKELAQISEKLKPVTNSMKEEMTQIGKEIQQKKALELKNTAEDQKKP